MRTKVSLLWTVFTLYMVLSAAGQQRIKTDSPGPPLWTEVKPLLDRVSTLPVEYRADLGLSILDQARSVIPSAAAIDFMDELFTAAPTARYQTAFIYGASNHENSSAAVEENSLRIKTADALSIQSSVVEHMLQYSPRVAAQRFAEIRPIPQRATCADATVQDLRSYYEALQALFADPKVLIFGAKARPEFLLDRFQEAQTPEQIVPLLTVLSRIDPGPDEGLAALQIAAESLDNLTASGRELDGLDINLNGAMQGIANYAERRHLPLTNIALAYRNFLVRSAKSPTCDGEPYSRHYTPVNFNSFRSRLRQDTQDIVSPLTPVDLQTTDQGAAAVDPPTSTLAGLPQGLQLRHANTGGVYDFRPPPAITEDEASAALSALTQDGSSDGCDLCLFQARIRLLETLTWRQSSGGSVRALLIAEVNYLSQNPMEQQDPPAFLAPLKILIETSRRTPVNPASTNSNKPSSTADRSKGYSLPERSAESDALREQLLLSSDPIISAYMEFETLFHLLYTPKLYVSVGH